MEFFDDLETRDPSLREERQFAELRNQIENAKTNAPYFAEALKDFEPARIVDRAALATLPVVRKGDLIELQKKRVAKRDPFGGMTAVKTAHLGRIFMSPGPIYDPEAMRQDYWRLARALWAAGFRRGDVIHNCFSYHLTPAGSMLEMGAHAIGCPVVPAGTGNTEQQVRAISDVRPAGYVGTPSFLKIIVEKAAELGADVSSLKRALVSGEAVPKALRGEMAAKGIELRQCYASADLGLIGYESVPDEGLILDEWLVVEIVRPGTGEALADGEVGEVVVSTLNPDYPLIRFGTGDLSMFVPGTSSCGRTNRRLRGWMGRADQTTKVKGMFVHPGQVAEAVARHKIAKFRLVVSREGDSDTMTLKVEAASDAGLAAKLAESLQATTKLKGAVEFAAPGTLPNDGKVIEDVRKYD
ncbi:MAG: AMP-binding protein [Alphaproteobacteria bacterium]|nr:AMP-binding protein [Alphaproteobacteria bacterium]